MRISIDFHHGEKAKKGMEKRRERERERERGEDSCRLGGVSFGTMTVSIHN